MRTAVTHDRDAAAVIELKAKAYAATRSAGNAARAGLFRPQHAEAMIRADAAVELACEQFRRVHYSSAGAVFCAGGLVLTQSPEGRRTRIVFDPVSR